MAKENEFIFKYDNHTLKLQRNDNKDLVEWVVTQSSLAKKIIARLEHIQEVRQRKGISNVFYGFGEMLIFLIK